MAAGTGEGQEVPQEERLPAPASGHDSNQTISSSAICRHAPILATGHSKGRVLLYVPTDLPCRWKPLAVLEAHKDDVTSLAWRFAGSEDDAQRTLVTASADRDIKFWQHKPDNLTAWSSVATFHTTHTEYISSVVWLEHGGNDILVTASGDKTIIVHTRTGKNLSDWAVTSVLRGHSGSIVGLDANVADDGTLCIASCSFDKTAYVWESPVPVQQLHEYCKSSDYDSSSWQPSELQGAEISTHGGDRRIRFSPTDGALLAVTAEKEVQLWERWESDSGDSKGKWTRSAVLPGHEGFVNSVDFREDGCLLGSVDHLGHVRLWKRLSEPDKEGMWEAAWTSTVERNTLWSCVFGNAGTKDCLAFGGFGTVPSVLNTQQFAEFDTKKVRKSEVQQAAIAKGILEVATLLKGDGNTSFKANKYAAAIEAYKNALRLLDLNSDVGEEFRQLRITCHSNIAASALGDNEFALAEEHCTLALELDSKHPKATYRRGMARIALDKLELAEEDFNAALAIVPDEPQSLAGLREIEFTRAYHYYNLGKDGKFDMDEDCYEVLYKKNDDVASYAEVCKGMHEGAIDRDKESGNYPKVLEDAEESLDKYAESIQEAKMLEQFIEAYSEVPAVQPAVQYGMGPDGGQEGLGCAQYALAHFDLSDCEPQAVGEARYLVPPGRKWPLNNGFRNILPVLQFTRVVLPAPGDIVVYTTGYVVDKDKIGFVRGQACLVGVVVEVESEGKERKITVQSKPYREGTAAFRHRLQAVPAQLFNVPGGGPFAYFFRR